MPAQRRCARGGVFGLGLESEAHASLMKITMPMMLITISGDANDEDDDDYDAKCWIVHPLIGSARWYSMVIPY